MRFPYHQFLTRPVRGVVQGLPTPSCSNSGHTLPLRTLVNIKEELVLDLSFHTLWENIQESLDLLHHDVASCSCCGAKGIQRDVSQKSFVLTFCGDLRELSSKGRTWPW
jgi:hypothetical protein